MSSHESHHEHDDDQASAAEKRTTTLKHNIEKQLAKERQDVQAGRLREENPLDTSPDFVLVCEASRRGDLRLAQEQITKGVNINARDEYDYTPLILASLCGHFELVQMLLEQGAKCERDTFQGERCLYNALNDRIRNLLLSYDYSKSTDPLQPLAAHVTSLLTRDSPQTADITLHTSNASFQLHKFVLSARSPYFRNKLREKPETKSWKLAPRIPTDSFETCIRYLYFGEASIATQDSEEDEKLVLDGVDKLSRQLEIPQVFDAILNPGDRRQARQRRQDEVEKGRDQMQAWFKEHVLEKQFEIDADDKTGEAQAKWKRDNSSFADVLLLADANDDEEDEEEEDDSPSSNIPIGPTSDSPRPRNRKTLFPAHRAMLLRSELFAIMFNSSFREGQITSTTAESDPTAVPNTNTTNNTTTSDSPPLQIIPVDCTPAVLGVILTFLYTENASFPLSIALQVLHAADMLFIEKLKQRAALLISTLGNGTAGSIVEEDTEGKGKSETPNNAAADSQPPSWIYSVIRSGWDCRVHRLEEFGARYLAYRLESYIDDEEFKELVRESAARITARQETDTVEIVDDIRYYLSERFRLRFEEQGLDELMDETRFDDSDGAGDGRVGEDGEKGGDVRGSTATAPDMEMHAEGVVRTLDGEIAGDEFAQDAMNYQILLGKIDTLLDELTLEA
jgi:ankyrin repeat/BTB/POZ domain-containing protein 1